MNLKIKKDFAVSIFFAVLAIAYLYGAESISVFNPFGDTGPDSRTVPQIIGWLMLLLSIALFFNTLIRHRKLQAESATVEKSDQTAETKKKIPVKLIISLVLLSLYIALYQSLGFILSSIAYLILQSFLLTPPEKRKKLALFIVGLSIVFTVVTYFIFSKYLTMSLPIGLLG